MIDNSKIFKITVGDSPLVAAAVHDGHQLRPEVVEIMALSEDERLREEDPFTGGWTAVAKTQVIGLKSRFEMDLNRPREKAVYIKPEDAWGLFIWKKDPTPQIISDSLKQYDAFYEEMFKLFSRIEKQYGHFVVFDLHTYNHRRQGPDDPIADPMENPEVNIGTGTMNRELWAPVVDRFISDLKKYNYANRSLDVRENIKFRGGNFSRWIHETFPKSGCSIAVEFKKFFMDEWSGNADKNQLKEIGSALKSTIPGVLEVLKRFE